MQSATEIAQPLIDRLRSEIAQRDTPLFVALDGRSGSGKSTIAAVVADALGTDVRGHAVVTVIEGDQFYGGGSGETWHRKSVEEKVAQVIDWQRQRLLLIALRDIGVATWLAFDWESEDWDADVVPFAPESVQSSATAVVLLEGAYSARPELSDLLDLLVLLEVPRELRRAQLLAREGEAYRTEWEGRWQSAEEHYFGTIMPRSNFDLIIGQNQMEEISSSSKSNIILVRRNRLS